jgi:hypothetical protein
MLISNPPTIEVNISTREPTSAQVFYVYERLHLNRYIFEGQITINLSELPTVILIFMVRDLKYNVLQN